MGHLLCKLNQVILHFALNPATVIFTDDKEIRRVQDPNWSALFTGVNELDGPWLIVKR